MLLMRILGMLSKLLNCQIVTLFKIKNNLSFSNSFLWRFTRVPAIQELLNYTAGSAYSNATSSLMYTDPWMNSIVGSVASFPKYNRRI